MSAVLFHYLRWSHYFFLKETHVEKIKTELRKIFEISEKMKKDTESRASMEDLCVWDRGRMTFAKNSNKITNCHKRPLKIRVALFTMLGGAVWDKGGGSFISCLSWQRGA